MGYKELLGSEDNNLVLQVLSSVEKQVGSNSLIDQCKEFVSSCDSIPFKYTHKYKQLIDFLDGNR